MKRLAFLIILFSATAAFAQIPTTPPMKLGLWQTESTTSITGADGKAETEKKTQRACVTADTWKDFAGGKNDAMKNCEKNETKYSGRTLTMDAACGKAGDQGGSSTTHFEITFDTAETGHASGRMDMNLAGTTMRIVSNLQTHFVSSSCGDIAPGESQDVK